MSKNETSKHTPGPWQVIACYPGQMGVAQSINDDRGNPVAGVSGCALHRPLGVPESNARLIAAAPALLEACKDALHAMKTGNSEVSAIASLQSAIALAEKGA